ncbi:MAG TPA: type II secretion system protein G [Thermoanaerobaculia bacterium]|jgi:type II secretory pathway pseudopilin PulG
MIVRRLAIVAALALVACTREQPDTREAKLRAQLTEMRAAIARFQKDNGRRPHSLQELVPRYLRAIPEDPFTNSNATWRVDTEEEVQPSADFTTSATRTEVFVLDVHSGAGKPYSDY